VQAEDSNAKDDDDDDSTPVKEKETSHKKDTGIIWIFFNFLHSFHFSIFLVLIFSNARYCAFH
jgi:hypothetical protein